jgi:hypothetical protein
MSSAIVRQWLILSMLPLRPRRIDTSAIEARLRSRGIDIHRRTIQRDLIELAEVFPIVADERAKPFGWRWSDDVPLIARVPPREEADTLDLTVRIPKKALDSFLQVLNGVDGATIVSPVALTGRTRSDV